MKRLGLWALVGFTVENAGKLTCLCLTIAFIAWVAVQPPCTHPSAKFKAGQAVTDRFGEIGEISVVYCGCRACDYTVYMGLRGTRSGVAEWELTPKEGK